MIALESIYMCIIVSYFIFIILHFIVDSVFVDVTSVILFISFVCIQVELIYTNHVGYIRRNNMVINLLETE